MTLPKLADLKIDFKYAPGWSVRECARRKAFLVRFDEKIVWVAAVNPRDISITSDMHWLTYRDEIRMAGISEETFDEALALFRSL